MKYYVVDALRDTPTNPRAGYGPYSSRSYAFCTCRNVQHLYSEYHIYHVIRASSIPEAQAIYAKRMK